MPSADLCRALRRRTVLGLSAGVSALALTLTPALPHDAAAARPASGPDARVAPARAPAPKPLGRQITKWFQDPVGKLAYQTRRTAGLDRAYGRNLAIGFVDITGLDDVDVTGYRVVDSGELAQSDPALYASLGLAAKPQVERFVIVPSFNNPSTADTKGAHSEIRFFSQELLYMGVTDPARTFLLYSDLSPCRDCAPRIPDTTEVRWMTRDGEGSHLRRERILNAAAASGHEAAMTDADRERNAEAVARTRQRTLDKRAREAERRARLWGKAPATPCPTALSAPLAAGRSGALAQVARRRSAVAARPVAAPCGEPDGKDTARAAPGGLGRALAGPVAESPGGIDFSALTLRYLADPGDGSGLQYAFEAPAAASGASPAAGTDAARLSSDAFFVWLALKPSTFWVNLNPTEPDRVVDADMGRTDVGRVMLQADLRLKKDVGRLVHPGTELGRRYHDRLKGTCSSSRVWVLPEPADIHADGEKLYVLKAPLSVRMEAEHIELPREKGGPGDCPEADEATRDHNEALFRSLILPELTKLVNGDPHYADLRRVHLSRVAAQWYRELGASRPTTYGELVDGGDIDAWTTRTGWKPKDTFDRYVHSYTEGDYRYSRKETKGDRVWTYTYVYGGVDLTAAPLRKMPESSFTARHAGLPKDVRASLTRPVGGAADGRLLMGARTPQQAAAGPGPSADGDDSDSDDSGGSGGSGERASGRSAVAWTWVWLPALLVPLGGILLWRRHALAPRPARPARGPSAGAPDRPRSPYDDYL